MSTSPAHRRAQERDGLVGPDRVRLRSILCRACARDCSERVDGTWRHDHDGSILDGLDGRCRNPEQVWDLADAEIPDPPFESEPERCSAHVADVRCNKLAGHSGGHLGFDDYERRVAWSRALDVPSTSIRP